MELSRWNVSYACIASKNPAAPTRLANSTDSWYGGCWLMDSIWLPTCNTCVRRYHPAPFSRP